MYKTKGEAMKFEGRNGTWKMIEEKNGYALFESVLYKKDVPYILVDDCGNYITETLWNISKTLKAIGL